MTDRPGAARHVGRRRRPALQEHRRAPTPGGPGRPFGGVLRPQRRAVRLGCARRVAVLAVRRRGPAGAPRPISTGCWPRPGPDRPVRRRRPARLSIVAGRPWRAPRRVLAACARHRQRRCARAHRGGSTVLRTAFRRDLVGLAARWTAERRDRRSRPDWQLEGAGLRLWAIAAGLTGRARRLPARAARPGRPADPPAALIAAAGPLGWSRRVTASSAAGRAGGSRRPPGAAAAPSWSARCPTASPARTGPATGAAARPDRRCARAGMQVGHHGVRRCGYARAAPTAARGSSPAVGTACDGCDTSTEYASVTSGRFARGGDAYSVGRAHCATAYR